MIAEVGNFFFHYRNGLFPLAYLLLFVPGKSIFRDYQIAIFLGTLIAVIGQFIRAATIGLDYIIRGGRNRRVYAETLVQGGIFAHCRNPLYVGNYLILLGVGVASNSLLFLVAAMPFFTFAYWSIIAAEESYLRNKFGPEFAVYCSRVNRLLPNLDGIGQTLRGMRFNWQRLVSAEYGSTFIWIAAIILVTLKNLWFSGEYARSIASVRLLWSLLAAAIFGYVVARYLKKSGQLDSRRNPQHYRSKPIRENMG